MKYGYAQVSTLHQDLESQLQALEKEKSDFKEGRPKKYGRKQIEHALQLLENNSYKQVESMTGISKSTLIRAVREQR
jgi:DNA invertase Pin-like site-specific DNA recombinase